MQILSYPYGGIIAQIQILFNQTKSPAALPKMKI